MGGRRRDTCDPAQNHPIVVTTAHPARDEAGAAEGRERCRVRVRAWCTIEMTSTMLIGTASAVAMFIPAMCLVVEMPSK